MDYSPELEKFFDIDILTDESKRKLETIYLNPLVGLIPKKLVRFMDRMVDAYNTEIIATIAKSDRNRLVKIMTGFDQHFNKIENSIFQKFVRRARNIMGIDLTIRSTKIRLNFIYDGSDDGYISAILHATNTFCHAINYNYDGLVIDVCLDNNIRSVDAPDDIPKNNIFHYLQKNSQAFNVSGLTVRNNRHIILTKKEDIVKLLFHELAHYSGIERNLEHGIHNPYDKVIPNQNLNLNEAFTEFISVIIATAYESIHLWGLNRDKLQTDDDLYRLYQTMLQTETQYSLYLSASILKFLGYDKDTLFKLFDNTSTIKFESPIYSFEYIIMRTSLLLNITTIIEAIDDDLGVNNPKIIEDNVFPDDNMQTQLATYMRNNNYDNNISYLLIDLDWNLV